MILIEGPWLCRECWGSDRDCNCDEPDYAPVYFKEPSDG